MWCIRMKNESRNRMVQLCGSRTDITGVKVVEAGYQGRGCLYTEEDRGSSSLTSTLTRLHSSQGCQFQNGSFIVFKDAILCSKGASLG